MVLFLFHLGLNIACKSCPCSNDRRYAELLSQSKSCAYRRANSALSRSRQRSLRSRFVRDDRIFSRYEVVSAPKTAGTIANEERWATVDSNRSLPLPMGSGALGQMELLHQRPTCGAILSTCHPSQAAEAYSSNDKHNDDEPATSSDLPASELVQYIGFLVKQRCNQQQQNRRLNEQATDAPALVPAAHVARRKMESSAAVTTQRTPLASDGRCPSVVFDGSALVAVAILVEELTKEFMTSWCSRHQSGGTGRGSQGVGALLKPSKRRVRVAADLQLVGALSLSSTATVDPDYGDEGNHSLSHLLRNRLEVRTVRKRDNTVNRRAVTRYVMPCTLCDASE